MREILIAVTFVAIFSTALAKADSFAPFFLSGDPISREADSTCKRDPTCIPLIVNTSGTAGAKEIFRLGHGGRICGPLRFINPETGVELFSLAAGACFPTQ